MRGIAARIAFTSLMFLLLVVFSHLPALACSRGAGNVPPNFSLRYVDHNGVPVAGLRVVVVWREQTDAAFEAWEQREEQRRDAEEDFPEKVYQEPPPYAVLVSDATGLVRLTNLPVGQHFMIGPEHGLSRKVYVKITRAAMSGEPPEPIELKWPETPPLRIAKLAGSLAPYTQRELAFKGENGVRWTIVDPFSGEIIARRQVNPTSRFAFDELPSLKLLIVRIDTNYTGGDYSYFGEFPIVIEPAPYSPDVVVDLDTSAGSLCGPHLVARSCDFSPQMPVVLSKVHGRLEHEKRAFPGLRLRLVPRGKIYTSESRGGVAMNGVFAFEPVEAGDYDLIVREYVGVTHIVPLRVDKSVDQSLGLEVRLPPGDVCKSAEVTVRDF